MEYYYHVWAGAPSCHLELLDKLQKRICKTVGPLLPASLESLVHCQNVASLIFFIIISLVDVHLNWLKWFHFFILEESLLVILSLFLDVTGICRCICANSFFPHAARPWNSLPIECFLLAHDPNGFKSRINRHLQPVGSF